jgi:hypothetical protein
MCDVRFGKIEILSIHNHNNVLGCQYRLHPWIIAIHTLTNKIISLVSTWTLNVANNVCMCVFSIGSLHNETTCKESQNS